MTGIDAKGYLAGWLQGLTSMYLADIGAIPDEKWTATYGGCTRPASDITADAISLLHWTTAAMTTGVPDMSDGDTMELLKAACSTKAGASTEFSSAVEGFSTALANASDETLGQIVTPPWQMDAPLFMIAQIAVSHVWYHDGQLNYIQCLLGDDKIHWMGG